MTRSGALIALVTLAIGASAPAFAQAEPGQPGVPFGSAATSKPLPVRTPIHGSADRIRAALPAEQQTQDVFGPFYILNYHSGKCLNVAEASTANGAPVIQWPCGSPKTNDLWWLGGASGGPYYIVNDYSRLCLNVAGASTANGAAVIQWPCGSPVTNDVWYVNLDVWTYVVNHYSRKCLNVAGASTADRAKVIQWPCGSSLPNDVWFAF